MLEDEKEQMNVREESRKESSVHSVIVLARWQFPPLHPPNEWLKAQTEAWLEF